MPKAVHGELTLDGNFDRALGLRFEHLARDDGADSGRPSGVAIVQFAPRLGAGQANFRRIDDHDEITGVLVGSVVGTSFAAEQTRRPRRNAAKGALSRIDNDPVTIAQSILTRDAAGLFGQLQIRAPKKLSLAGPMGFEPPPSHVTAPPLNPPKLPPPLHPPFLP